ncbi:MAG TPA: tryptophan synthase subunit alpha [Microthrixaceae bacterium]|nr:tryptophan synthase subunit alpha [Microthrixaceae bacterium]
MSADRLGSATSAISGTVADLESTLRARRASGGKCLVPYLTGGLFQGEAGDWTDMLRAVAASGADGIEVGIPFSDPVMDGPVIQEASELALRSGATPPAILESLSTADAGVPLAVMTYVNLVYRFGYERFASTAMASGVSAVILPDVPLEESAEWCAAADAAGVQTVMLAAPTAPDDRLTLVVARARGFVYAVGLMGVTGERDSLAGSAKVIASRLKDITDLPVLVGVGISTPAQAVEVCEVADGVVVGSALVRTILETRSTDAAAELVGSFRDALDRG